MEHLHLSGSIPPSMDPTLSPGLDVYANPDALLASLLDSQRELTAVERFDRFHEGPHVTTSPGRYEALLPATPPGPGQQYAFEVDLDRCSGCKACVTACHSLNGLDDGESWRDVGLIVGGEPGLPVLQHITSSCHHCLDPACLSACPVDAYEKDPVTGIVRHLDDQCFGCQYCTLACPYDAPKFLPKQGIVRKCDMCSDRLRDGEAPACAQACPHEAIRIRLINVNESAERAAAGEFLPATFDPSYTRPTTIYKTTRPFGLDVEGSDHHRIKPQHAHAPLVVMLTLTQLAVGAFVLDFVLQHLGVDWKSSNSHFFLLWVGFVVGQIGLAASLAHLGRPWLAYRALIGIRHSWLSREVAAFGLFAGASAAATLLPAGLLGFRVGSTLEFLLSLSAAMTGILGVGASVMVYHVVRRPFWNASRIVPSFAGTALLLGLATALSATAATSNAHLVQPLAWTLIASTAVKLIFESSFFRHLKDAGLTPLRKSAELLVGPLARPTLFRYLAGFVGGVIFPCLILWSDSPRPVGMAIGSLVLLVAGELTERYLFFSAVTQPKMPGS